MRPAAWSRSRARSISAPSGPGEQVAQFVAGEAVLAGAGERVEDRVRDRVAEAIAEHEQRRLLAVAPDSERRLDVLRRIVFERSSSAYSIERRSACASAREQAAPARPVPLDRQLLP